MGELVDEPDEFFTAKCIYATDRHLADIPLDKDMNTVSFRNFWA